MKTSIATRTRRIRLVVRGVLSNLVFRLRHRKGFDPRDSILIFGSIRSGSTWLAEVLSELDGHVQIFEPLHPEYVPQIKKAIKQRNFFMPRADDWIEGKLLFERILSGKLTNSWIMSQAPLRKVLLARRLVVKFVRGNLLLDWVTTHLPTRKPILVMRHPCAIICSQINKGWKPGKQLLLDNLYLDDHPNIRRQCEQLSEPEEIAALAWCLRYHAPLSSPKPYRFVLVTYENLVRNGAEELRRICQELAVPLVDSAIEQLTVPSNTVTKNSQIMSDSDPLSGWKHRLSDRQVENILAVLNIFGMGFYSASLEPDYKKLSEFGSSTPDE